MIDISKLTKVCTVKKYSQNEIIFKFGDQGHDMYIILSGEVEVFINNEGISQQVAQLKAGDFFGEMSLLEGLPRSATIRTKEETIVILINEDNFESVIYQEPALAYRIMKGLSSRVRKQNEDLVKLKSELSRQKNTEDLITEPNHITEPNDLANSGGIEQPVLSESSVSLEGEGENDQSKPVIYVENQNESNFWEKEIGKPNRNYTGIKEVTDQNFLFDKTIKCPVCNHSFNVKMIRSSKLRLKTIEPDFRRRYENFEPLWFNIWACPNCLYANVIEDFESISDKGKKIILGKSKEFKENIAFVINQTRGINQVISIYYLILYWIKELMPDSSKLAKVWLRIAWLYEDLSDSEMSQMALAKALEFFKDFQFNTKRKTSAEQDQYLWLIMGELSIRCEQFQEAKQFLRNAVVHKGGNIRMNNQALDRLQELKEKTESSAQVKN